MKGLIYKEFCVFKGQFKSWIFAFIIFGIYAAVLKSVSMLFTMTAMFGFLSCLTTFTYDKTYHCEEYIAAMPVSRKMLVLSKYLFLFLVDIAITLFSLIVALVFSMYFKSEPYEILLQSASVMGTTILLQLIAIPIVYKWGPDKARIIFILLGISPCLLLVLNKDRLPSISEETVLRIMQLSPLVLIALLVISIMISVSIYRKKEF